MAERDRALAGSPETPRPGARRRSRWRYVVPVATALAGALFVASAISSDGNDLRPAATDLSSVVAERTHRVADGRARVDRLRKQIDAISSRVDSAELVKQRAQVRALSGPAGFTKITGPGLRVTLQDAPRGVDEPGLDPNALVVHQQDIQAFVNALWAGGATAITLQGRRLISTTGVKCVGNTVVLDGVPYSPPYVIEAVGVVDDLYSGLADAGAVQTYREYVVRYRLGLEVGAVTRIVAPPYADAPDLTHATALR